MGQFSFLRARFQFEGIRTDSDGLESISAPLDWIWCTCRQFFGDDLYFHGREMMHALIPPTPMDSLPAGPAGAGTASSQTKSRWSAAICGFSSPWESGVGKIVPRS